MAAGMTPTAIPYLTHVWPVVTGCSPAGEGCWRCYAARLAGTRLRHHPRYQGLAVRVNKDAYEFTGEVRFHADLLDAPLRRRKPSVIGVAFMGDLFHPKVTDEQIDEVFAVMALTPHLTYIVLTKRPERMREYVCEIQRADEMAPGDKRWLTGGHRLGEQIGWPGDLLMLMEHLPGGDENWMFSAGEPGAPAALEWSGDTEEPVIPWPLPNVVLGTSVWDQESADRNIPHLLNTPAACRVVSVEPMIGPVDLSRYVGAREFFSHEQDYSDPSATVITHGALHGIFLGGETGPWARPMNPEWALSDWRQCKEAGVPFYWKSMGDAYEQSDWSYTLQMQATCELPEVMRL